MGGGVSTALERIRIRQCTGDKAVSGEVHGDDVSVLVFGVFDVEAPEKACEVKKDTPFRDMESWTIWNGLV